MFDVEPLTGVFGAELTSLRLTDGWDKELITKIRETLRDHKVLLIRDQTDLSARQLADFASEFGMPETRAHPSHADFPDVPEVKMLRTDGESFLTKDGGRLSSSDRDGWHTDGCVRADTNHWVSFLYAHDVPPYGRDTLFADMEAVYDRMSVPIKGLLDGLTAVHKWPRATTDDTLGPVEHPVVFVDPETGGRSVYVNQGYTAEIVGLRPDESRVLLDLLFEQTHRPQVQLRVVWKPGSLAIWDNRRTVHFAVIDRPGYRVMYRVMVTPAI